MPTYSRRVRLALPLRMGTDATPARRPCPGLQTRIRITPAFAATQPATAASQPGSSCAAGRDVLHRFASAAPRPPCVNAHALFPRPADQGCGHNMSAYIPFAARDKYTLFVYETVAECEAWVRTTPHSRALS